MGLNSSLQLIVSIFCGLNLSADVNLAKWGSMLVEFMISEPECAVHLSIVKSLTEIILETPASVSGAPLRSLLSLFDELFLPYSGV